MTQTIRPTEEERAARKRRSRFIALALIGFMALVFLVTIANMRQNAQMPAMRWEQSQ
jgi:hypothetical protein